MGRKRINLVAVIPAAAIGIVCAGIGAATGCKTSKEVILKKGVEGLCGSRKKK